MLSVVFSVLNTHSHQSVFPFVENNKILKLFNTLQQHIVAVSYDFLPMVQAGFIQGTFHQAEILSLPVGKHQKLILQRSDRIKHLGLTRLKNSEWCFGSRSIQIPDFGRKRCTGLNQNILVVFRFLNTNIVCLILFLIDHHIGFEGCSQFMSHDFFTQ